MGNITTPRLCAQPVSGPSLCSGCWTQQRDASLDKGAPPGYCTSQSTFHPSSAIAQSMPLLLSFRQEGPTLFKKKNKLGVPADPMANVRIYLPPSLPTTADMEGHAASHDAGGRRLRHLLSSDDESIVVAPRSKAKRCRRHIQCSDDESDDAITQLSPQLPRHVSPNPTKQRTKAPGRRGATPPTGEPAAPPRSRSRNKQPRRRPKPPRGNPRSPTTERTARGRKPSTRCISANGSNGTASCKECGGALTPSDPRQHELVLKTAVKELDTSIKRSQRQWSATARKLSKLRQEATGRIPESKPPRGLFLDIHGGLDECCAATHRKLPETEVTNATNAIFGTPKPKPPHAGAVASVGAAVESTGDWAVRTREELLGPDVADTGGVCHLVRLFQQHQQQEETGNPNSRSLARASSEDIKHRLAQVQGEASRTRSLMHRISHECDARMHTLELFETALRARRRTLRKQSRSSSSSRSSG